MIYPLAMLIGCASPEARVDAPPPESVDAPPPEAFDYEISLVNRWVGCALGFLPQQDERAPIGPDDPTPAGAGLTPRQLIAMLSGEAEVTWTAELWPPRSLRGASSVLLAEGTAQAALEITPGELWWVSLRVPPVIPHDGRRQGCHEGWVLSEQAILRWRDPSTGAVIAEVGPDDDARDQRFFSVFASAEHLGEAWWTRAGAAGPAWPGPCPPPERVTTSRWDEWRVAGPTWELRGSAPAPEQGEGWQCVVRIRPTPPLSRP